MVEKLEQENGSYFVRDVEYFKDNRYIYQPHGRVLNYTHRYWYDGVCFLIGGYFSTKPEVMIEVESGAFVANKDFIDGKCIVEKLIAHFKQQLQNSGLTIHEVIRNFKLRNLNIEAWEVNFLIV